MRVAIVVLLLSGASASCSAPVSPAFPSTPNCSGEEQRSLDFWVGDWDVKSPGGDILGRNQIQKTLRGCALEERWTDCTGAQGMSLFFFDRARRRWKQVWVTDDGTWKEKLEMPGASPGGIRFEGLVPRPAGGSAIDRTTLTPSSDHVTQLIERSIDGGATWEAWTGVYTRRLPKETCRGNHRELDFWVGDWDLLVKTRTKPGADVWSEQRGENKVTSVLDGCGVEESFSARGGSGDWAGKSLSRFVDAEGKWRQTWIGDGGEYLTFVGEKTGGDVVLRGEPRTVNGVTTVMRMVFTAITPAAFLWRWEASRDGGETWAPQMLIEYTRKRGSR